MEHKVFKNPFGMIEFTLNKNESIKAKRDAMIYYHGNITIKAQKQKSRFFLQGVYC